MVADWCAQRGCAEVVDTLDAAGITAERVRTFAEAATDPQVHARAMVQETVLSNGSTAPLTGPAVKFSRTPTAVRSGAPEPGADTDRVLDEVGVDAATRERLRAQRAIR